MPLAADVQLPTFPPASGREARATIWIASEAPPFQALTWTLLNPIPDGYHEVTQAEAERINRRPTPVLAFSLGPGGTGLLRSEAAALPVAGPSPGVDVERRPSRTPRAPRAPRRPRAARRARSPRPARASRPQRFPRRPRPPRPPRPRRPPRARRPRNYKTRQNPGRCKGPSCNCWTPGGCVPASYFDLPGWRDSTCNKGPCFTYEQCAEGRCLIDISCQVNIIFDFWARQYRNTVAYVAPRLTALPAVVRAILAPKLPIVQATIEPGALPGPPPGATAHGCPPGHYFGFGLTGIVCVPNGSGAPVVPEDVLRAYGFIP